MLLSREIAVNEALPCDPFLVGADFSEPFPDLVASSEMVTLLLTTRDIINIHGVSSLVHYLLCHVTAYAFRRKFGPLTLCPKKVSEMLKIHFYRNISFKYIETFLIEKSL